MHDVVIVGAGAAGLAAARLLHDAGRHVLIVEARNRTGGRIHTDRSIADYPVELGAEFIHGDHAATHALVRAAGLSTLPVVRMDNLWWADTGQPARPRGQWSGDQQRIIDGLLNDYTQLPDSDLREDQSLADYLRGRGWDGGALDIADVLLAQTCCAPLEGLSCYDLIREMRVDHAGHGEARIVEGYDTLLAAYQRDLPVLLNTKAREILWGNGGVTLHTTTQTLSARACIITVPVSLLQRGTMRFTPALGRERMDAIAAFRTEPATKLIYRFDRQLWEDDLTFMAHPGTASRWWTPGYTRDSSATMACFITAERARTLDALPEADALALGLAELAHLLGMSPARVRDACAHTRRVSWVADPLALGGYAHIPPGAADARVVLAQAEADRLFFAGEATAHDTNPQTVHGALESGWRAARECLAALPG